MVVDGVGPGGVTADDRRWEREATDLRHTSLATIRASATAWEQSIAGLLGVFGLIAFIKGPEALGDLGTTEAVVVTVLILVAVAAALVAITKAAQAAQGVPAWTDRLDGAALREHTRTGGQRAAHRLLLSRILAIGSAVCVLAAMAVAWLSSIPSDGEVPVTNVLIVSSTGQLWCGRLITDGGELRLSPTGQPPGLPVPEVQQITAVESCP